MDYDCPIRINHSSSFNHFNHSLDNDDIDIAKCPEVGTVDQGETIEQAIAGLKEATRLYLEELTLPQILH